MENKPEYRLVIGIYDTGTGVNVAESTTYLGQESGEAELSSLLRHFDKEGRQQFEAVHYPTNNDL
jgi:hypothetical protein